MDGPETRRAPFAGEGEQGSKRYPNASADQTKIRDATEQVHGPVTVVEDTHTLARMLGGEVIQGSDPYVVFPPSWHSAHDRSGIVRFRPRPDGRADLYFDSFAEPENWRAIRADVLDRLGIAEAQIRIQNPGAATETKSREEKIAGALRIWHQARSPIGTPVEAYLASRLIRLPPEAANTAVRFHGACPFGPGQTLPCLVALVRDIASGEPLGIHRTALNWKGEKVFANTGSGAADRMSLGPVKGGAIKLGRPSTALGVAEGLENALSLREYEDTADLAVWSLVHKSGLAQLPVLTRVATLWIAEDDDIPGREAARTTRLRWEAAGRTVRLAGPRGGTYAAPKGWPRGVEFAVGDLNDLLRWEANQ